MKLQTWRTRKPQHFAFVVPMGRADDGYVDRCACARRERIGLSESKDNAANAAGDEHFSGCLTYRDGERRFIGDVVTHPVVMLRDTKTGEVRGFLRGGDATIEDVPESLELQLSDGVKSRVVLRNQRVWSSKRRPKYARRKLHLIPATAGFGMLG